MSLVGKKIQVIDDDQDILILVKKVLEGAGASCIIENNSEAGIDLALKESPHLIICDIAMPGINGFGFLEKKQTISKIKNIPTLVFSAHNSKNLVYRAMALGASEYLNKPLESRILLQKIRKILFHHGKINFVELDPQPKLEIQFGGEIVFLGKEFIAIDSLVKLIPKKLVKLESQLFDECGLKNLPVRVVWRAPTSNPEGEYRATLKFVGLTNDFFKKFENLIRRWK